MFSEFISGALLVFEWPAFGYLLLGILVGLWLGAVPGLGGGLGIVLALPFTYGMEPAQAIALLLGIYAVTATSDTIPSVMLGIPGTASSQATVLDGHPLARSGKAARAFGAAFTVSAFGGIFGALMLAVSLPLALPIILKFNNPELFMLAVAGLVMVSSLSGASLVKGLIGACLGLLLSTVGYADDASIPRYWLGTPYLLDSLPLIPVVLGLFAVPELMDLALRDSSISRVDNRDGGSGEMMAGVRAAFREWWLVLRCSAIGVYIGMIPGLGGAVVDWIAYGHAFQSSKDNSRFGKGDIRGVIAPEAANNAVRGGALIPTVAFGIPGSAMNALLLSALLIQGLQPGRAMLTTNLDITFSMVWTIAIANVLAAGLLMVWSGYIARLAFLPSHWIVPGVMLFVLMGAWSANFHTGDWVSLLAFSAIGFVMKRGGWARPPVILAFILGGLMENSFLLSWKIHQGVGWLSRPIVVVLGIVVVLTIAFAIRTARKKATTSSDNASLSDADDEEDMTLSLLSAVLLAAVFAAACLAALAWPTFVRAFPLIAAVPGLGLVLVLLSGESRRLARVPGAVKVALQATIGDPTNRKAAMFFGYLLALFVAALLIGQKLAIPAFVAIYLLRWGRFRGAAVAGYACVCWAILVLFYDRIVHILWMRPALAQPIDGLVPDWLPLWLIH